MPPKHSDTLPGDKLLALYKRLTLNSKRHFQADIARDLECSPQTVTRLVGTVERNLGKDAYVEKGLDGRRRYYLVRAKSEEKCLGFSFEELHHLALCRDLAAPFLPENVAERMDSTLIHLALMLGEQYRPGHTIGFCGKGYIDYSPHLNTIARLRTAIDKRQVCKVTYTANGRVEATVYRYAPGRILAMGGTLYVQGYRLAEGSVLQDRPTTFSLHRISEISPTGEYFNFNAAEGEARNFGLDWHEPKRISVHIAHEAADYVRDRIWSDDQTIENHPDGGITLTVTTTSEKELNAWVLSFGGLARFIETQHQPWSR